jgi:hypothetical protein
MMQERPDQVHFKEFAFCAALTWRRRERAFGCKHAAAKLDI